MFVKRKFNFDVLRKNHTLAHLLSFLVIVLIAVITISPKIKATGNYAASNVLGQIPFVVDEYTKTYTQATADSRLYVGPVGFNTPYDTLIDTVKHRMFVTDSANSRVLVFDLDASDVPVDGVADYVLGQPDMNSNTGGTTDALLKYPRSLVLDQARELLYVNDVGNNRVMVFNVDSIADGEPAVNVLGQVDFTANSTITPTQSTFHSLTSGIAYDPRTDLLYVGDGNNGSALGRILVFDVRPTGSGTESLCGTDTTGIANGMNASCVIGQADFTTIAGGLTQSKLSTPTSLAIDSVRGLLFEGDSYNRRVMVFDVRPEGSISQDLCGTTTSGIATGMNASCVLGQSNFTTNSILNGQNRTGFASGLDYDPVAQQLFVTDMDNSRVLVFDVRPEGSTPTDLCRYTSTGIANFMNASCVFGQSDFTGTGGATTASRLSSPGGLFYDAVNKFIYVTDRNNNRLMVFNADTAAVGNGEDAVGEIGQYILTYVFDNTPLFTRDYINAVNQPLPNEAGFNSAQSVAVDTVHHRVFVSDGGNNRVLVFNLDSANELVDHVADYVLGQNDFTSSATSLSDTGIGQPRGLAYDAANDRLFVVDSAHTRVLVFDTTTITNGMAASYVLGQADFTTNNPGTTQNSFSYLSGQLAYDSVRKRLFVAEDGSCRVLVFNVDVSTITNGQNADNVLGEPDFTSANCFSSQETMVYVGGVAYDENNNRLFVAEPDGSRVLVFDTTTITDGEPAINILGQVNFTDVNPGLSQNTLAYPAWLSYDTAADVLFVGDQGNNRTLTFDVSAITDGEDAIGVIGQSDYTSNDNSIVDRNSQNASAAGAFGFENRTLYVADSPEYRVLFYKLPSLNSTSFPDSTEGVAYSEPILTSNIQGTLSFEVVSGVLPTGLSISGGDIIGTPTTPGVYSFILRAIDTPSVDNNFYSNKSSYSITINPAAGGGTSGSTGGSTGGSSGSVPYICSNSFDDDGDSLADINDPGCHSDGNPTNPATYVPGDTNETDVPLLVYLCSDGIDNDNDGLTDWPNDPGCLSSSDDSEVNPTSSYECSDGIDNEADGFIDFPADAGCLSATDISEYNAPATYRCSDNIDNDGDTIIDFPNDPGCTSATDDTEYNVPPLSYECSDGDDNDGDSLIDYPDDTGCTSSSDNSEQNAPPVYVCSDGMDNDSDTLIDYPSDTGCISATDTDEADASPLTYVCSDGIDNDSDNLIDYPNDLGCSNATDNDEYNFIPQDPCVTDPSSCVVNPPPPPTGGSTPTGTVVATIVSTVGVIIGGVGMLLSSFFLNPLSFGQIVLLPGRMWSLMLIAFGFKKRARPWGVIYDAVTKQPIDPAVVALFDKEGKEVGSCITDLDGRYGFIVDPGIYQLVVKKTNYEFPSHSLAGHTHDELYDDLYFGGFFEVKEKGEVVKKNIPMDPLKFDWNEYTKNKKELTHFYTRHSVLWGKIYNILFVVGFSSSIIAVIVTPVWFNIIIFALYILLLALKQVQMKPKSGQVMEKATNMPLGFGILRVYRASLRKEVMARALTTDGRYYALVPNGQYYVIIDRKNDDQSYKHMFQSEVFDVKNGIINQKFNI